MDEVVLLKLGGSLITEKTQRYHVRQEKLVALASEIRLALTQEPRLKLVLGHGSGSFGHFAFVEHLNPDVYAASARARDRSEVDYWKGVAEVWYRAAQLNRHVLEALHGAGVPAIGLAPSASATSSGGKIAGWTIAPLIAALDAGVLPVIHGDIVFDPVLGAKVLSTEVLMWHLAATLKPRRILLAGMEEAVWADFPVRSDAIARITPRSFPAVSAKIGASQGPDVTGGMNSKVREMLDLVQRIAGLRVQVFSGEPPGNLHRALLGHPLGTLICSDETGGGDTSPAL